MAYPDLVGFGRRNMDVTSAELQADVMYQIGALQGLATAAGTQVRYVKPHGALYNTIAHDERQAKAVIAAVRAVDPRWCWSPWPVRHWCSGRATRAFAVVGGPLPPTRPIRPRARWCRAVKRAVLHDDTLVAQRMLRLVREGVVEGHRRQPGAHRCPVHLRARRQRRCGGDGAKPRALEQDGVVLRSL